MNNFQYSQLQNSEQFLVLGLDPIIQWFFNKISGSLST